MGLRRNQIENLILRGPVFYWRARIPVSFRASGKNARLSLSLRLSNRKKASVVARQLNALLLQMEILPEARMATREQLARIFALEIEMMRAEIEALDRSAKRRGTLRSAKHREADRHVGWAYRLLQSFGAAEKLSFEEGDDGYEALIEAGVSVDDIPYIATTYYGERSDALSAQNHQARSPFLDNLLYRMAQVGLDDTALNREATVEEVYRAGADALLASANDPRRPKLNQPDIPEPARVERISVPPPPKPALLWSEPAKSEPEEAGPIIDQPTNGQEAQRPAIL